MIPVLHYQTNYQINTIINIYVVSIKIEQIVEVLYNYFYVNRINLYLQYQPGLRPIRILQFCYSEIDGIFVPANANNSGVIVILIGLETTSWVAVLKRTR